MSPEEFYTHAMQAADGEGRLPLSRMTGWEVFPFEQAGLRVVPLARPVLPEPARAGENARDCPACTASRVPVWFDEHWRLSPLGPSGAPLILMLKPAAHRRAAVNAGGSVERSGHRTPIQQARAEQRRRAHFCECSQTPRCKR
jgi:hypothetical protein